VTPCRAPRPPKSIRIAVGALALLLTTAACGIPTDNQPRAISPSSTASQNAEAPTTMDPNSANRRDETVYLVEGSASGSSDGERLSPRTVHVPKTSDVAELAQSTLKQLIAQQSDKGLTNAVPSGTRILGTRLNDDATELTINLSQDFNDVQQSLQRRAFAQLVFTATGLTPAHISRVRFEIDGVPRAAATGNDVTPGAGDSVTRADYPSFDSATATSDSQVGSG
jgi:hypothetical protein